MIPPDLRVFQRLGADADHRVAARALEEAGWQPCGTGDWAFVFRSPSGTRAARLSPFDPCAPYTARFYREAADTREVPRLDLERGLDGGASLLVLEYFTPVAEPVARAFLAAVSDPGRDDARGDPGPRARQRAAGTALVRTPGRQPRQRDEGV